MKTRSLKRRTNLDPLWTHRPVVMFVGMVAALSTLTFLPCWLAIKHSEAVFTARAAAFLLQTTGHDVVAAGAHLGRPQGLALLTVEERCGMTTYAILLTASILASQSGLGMKTAGIAAALFALGALNALRIAALFLISAHAPGWFPVAHLQLSPTVLLIAVFGLAVLWLTLVRRPQQS
jgi:exosortase/archaeosortase family protein